MSAGPRRCCHAWSFVTSLGIASLTNQVQQHPRQEQGGVDCEPQRRAARVCSRRQQEAAGGHHAQTIKAGWAAAGGHEHVGGATGHTALERHRTAVGLQGHTRKLQALASLPTCPAPPPTFGHHRVAVTVPEVGQEEPDVAGPKPGQRSKAEEVVEPRSAPRLQCRLSSAVDIKHR